MKNVNTRYLHSAALLTLGTLLIVLANFRWSVGLTAWVAPVPFLFFINRHPSKKAKLVLAVVLCMAWSAATLKIMTAPLPPVMALMYGVPLGLFSAFGFALWDALRKGLSSLHQSLSFAAIFVVVEFAQHTLTPLGSWGAAAYTQLGNLALMQSASLVGIAGISFLVYWGACLIGQSLLGTRARKHLVVWGLLLAAANIWGTLRIGLGTRDQVESTQVAAVGTDATFSGLPLPSPARVLEINKTLYARTSAAAAAGAKLVVWTEAATLAFPEDEAAFVEVGRALAKRHQIDLVMAYVVPLTLTPLRFENKFVWITPDGSLDHQYLKHRPVPGEPAVRGTSEMRSVQTTSGTASGAICYDYDFPAIGRQHAALNLDLVVLPSSDWLGIDPVHSYMAGVRAIEGGHNLLRSTRMGLSVGIDAYGRVLGELSSNSSTHRILMVSLPKRSVNTIYNRIGDSFVYLLLAYLAALLVHRVRRRGR